MLITGYWPVNWGVAASQFYLLSLTPLSGAGGGRLQLGAVHRVTSVTLMQVDENLAYEQLQ